MVGGTHFQKTKKPLTKYQEPCCSKWWSHRESNPSFRRERPQFVASSAWHPKSINSGPRFGPHLPFSHKKRPSRNPWKPLLGLVGTAGFEPATTCPPEQRSAFLTPRGPCFQGVTFYSIPFRDHKRTQRRHQDPTPIIDQPLRRKGSHSLNGKMFLSKIYWEKHFLCNKPKQSALTPVAGVKGRWHIPIHWYLADFQLHMKQKKHSGHLIWCPVWCPLFLKK
jgi:hypothetical protein